MKKVIIALLGLGFGHSALAQNTSRHIEHYILVKNALVNGDSKTASKAAISFLASIREEADFTGRNELLTAASAMSQATDLEKQRTALNSLSVNLWKVIKTGKSESPVYYQYCPMKKAYWISQEKQIKNPYYGAAMLTCGNVAETR